MNKEISNNLSEISSGAVIILVGAVFGKFIAVFSQILLARILSIDDFGIYNFLLSIVLILSGISVFGMGATIVRYVPFYLQESPGKSKGFIFFAFWFCSILSFFFTTIFILYSSQISLIIFEVDYSEIFNIFFITIPIVTINIIFINIYQSLKKSNYKVFIDDFLLRIIFLSLIVVAYFFFSFSLRTIAVSYLLSNLLIFLINSYIWRTSIYPNFNLVKAEFVGQESMKFALPLAFSVFVMIFYERINIVILGYYTDPSSIGYYSSAYILASSLTMFSIAFGFLFIPLVSKLWSLEKHKEIDYIYNKLTTWIIAITIPISLFLIVFPRQVLLIFGKTFSPASDVLIIFSISFILGNYMSLNRSVLMIGLKTKICFISDLLGVITNLSVTLLLLPSLGIIGAGIGFLSARIVSNFLQLYFVYVFFNLHPFQYIHLKFLTLSIFLISLVYLWVDNYYNMVHMYQVFLVSIGFFVLYLYLIFKIRLIDDQDKIIFQNIFRN